MDWFEIVEVPIIDKSLVRVLHLFNQTWICRYPRLKRVRFDNGSELKNKLIPLLKDFAVKSKPTSTTTIIQFDFITGAPRSGRHITYT